MKNKKILNLIKQGLYAEAETQLSQMTVTVGSMDHLETLKILCKIHTHYGQMWNVHYWKHYIYFNGGADKEIEDYVTAVAKEAVEKEKLILSGTSMKEDESTLVDIYFYQARLINACALAKAINGPSLEEFEREFAGIKDCQMVTTAFNDINNIYILAETDNQDQYSMDLLLNCLSNIGKRVYYIRKPVDVIVNELNYIEEDIVYISLNNQELNGNVTFLTPLKLIHDSTQNTIVTTRMLLTYITKKHQGEGRFLFIADEQVCQSILSEKGIAKLQLSSIFFAARNDMRMYEIGEYQSIYSAIYNFNITEALDAPNECKISIVIATRNCPETLRYTLLTCLEQEDFEDYEIVLSDNGDPGDDTIFLLAEELNQKTIAEGKKPKIKYYHTPGPLSLPKSFEFAYLHAKGEFIFGLGSDDGIMPDGLKTLAEYLEDYPNDDVIAWNRNTYFWSNFMPSKKDLIGFTSLDFTNKVERFSARELLQLAVLRKVDLYTLPMCYINSGMRRSYIKKIIQSTGTFIGGIGQDIYLGILNLCLNKDIPYIMKPITIAGQSGKSIGARDLVGIKDAKETQQLIDEWQKILRIVEPEQGFEKLMPCTNWDHTILINQLLRLQGMGLGAGIGVSEDIFKDAFEQALDRINPQDIRYIEHVQSLKKASKYHSEEFYNWFKPFVEVALSDDYRKSRKKNVGFPTKKTYAESHVPNDNGIIFIDGSNHGVTNIHEAVRFISQWKAKV